MLWDQHVVRVPTLSGLNVRLRWMGANSVVVWHLQGLSRGVVGGQRHAEHIDGARRREPCRAVGHAQHVSHRRAHRRLGLL